MPSTACQSSTLRVSGATVLFSLLTAHDELWSAKFNPLLAEHLSSFKKLYEENRDSFHQIYDKNRGYVKDYQPLVIPTTVKELVLALVH